MMYTVFVTKNADRYAVSSGHDGKDFDNYCKMARQNHYSKVELVKEEWTDDNSFIANRTLIKERNFSL